MRKLSYIQIIIISFAALILVGTCLLMLPIASRTHTVTPFIDALFTSTSATCVTGLIVHDTYMYWSLFGQLVIIILIQVGGIGFMTVATLFALMLRRKISMTHRSLISTASNTMNVGGAVRLTKHILMGTFIFEGLGALLLSFRFIPQMGFLKGVYNAFFHSVSAFCNAGFDIMGKYGEYGSLSSFAGDYLVNFVIMALIIIGGIGFIVWEDVLRNKFRWSKYLLHTKIVLSMTAFLLIVPPLLIFFIENWNGFGHMNLAQSLTSAFFQAVAPRTAGFFTVNYAGLSSAVLILTIFLMVIGGSPGSTAGGIKTSTVFVIFRSAISTIKNDADIFAFKRRFDEGALRNANTIFLIYMGVSFIAIFLLSYLHKFSLEAIIFEVFSAIGTVGLSLGITPQLGIFAKIILSLLMFFGRIGVLSIALAFAKQRAKVQLQYPKEKFMIG